mgnify:CR=1 FL=1
MASVRLNLFESYPLIHQARNASLEGVGTLHMLGVEMPGSISFNNLAMIVSGSGGVSEDMSLSFGLYSLNGSTLSLANSASMGTALTLNQTMFSWLSFATSATQDITPGNWYFAVMSSTTLGGSFSLVINNWTGNAGAVGGEYGGIFVRGKLSVSTNALPASIATSDMSKEGQGITVNIARQPYILISA